MSAMTPEEINKLVESEEKYRKMVELANDAIVNVDSETGRIVEINSRCEKMLVCRRDEIVGKMVRDLYPSDEIEEAGKFLDTVGFEGRGIFNGFHFKQKDGLVVTVDISAAVIEFGGKKVIQLICREVSSRLESDRHDAGEKPSEQTRELAEKQAQLVQMEKMATLGNLVAGVAHEINTPLGALNSNNDFFVRAIAKIKEILTNSEIPDKVKNHPELKKYFDNIDKLNEINTNAVSRIIRIVTGLRRFARQDQVEKQLVNIRNGLDSTLELVHHQLKNRVDVVRDYDNIPKIRCYANQLNQVFMNLLVNASQAIEGKGKITIKGYQTGDNVIIEIIDTGKGIEKENLGKIFDPTFTTKETGVGTGLGLSIVKRIISDHGGEIQVESEKGRGTVFRVILPIGKEVQK